MYFNQNYLVTYFEGKPDMWNTKPPLMIWLQVLFMKIIGINETALRLPSALAAFTTSIILIVFSNRFLKNPIFGLIAVCILITSWGFVNLHASRTGDYDALLTLFTTTSCLSFFAYCQTKKTKYLYWFFLALALGVLTKSVNALLFTPALAIYALYSKNFLSLIRNKHMYLALLLFTLVVAGYYLLREYYNPGYLQAVQENELGGRYLNTLEEHKQDFWFYYNNFIKFQFSSYIILLPCGIVVGLLSVNQKLRQLTIFLTICTLTFFLVISTAQTKLEWYDVPLYPLMALLTSIMINFLFDYLKSIEYFKSQLALNFIPFVFLFVVFVNPYAKIINKTYKPQEYKWDAEFYDLGYFLRRILRNQYQLNNSHFLYEGYNAHNLFYLRLLNDKGINVKYKDYKFLQEGDTVIVQQPEVLEYLKDHYRTDSLAAYNSVKIYRIDEAYR